MAIYHCSIKNISRGTGRSVVASAAYRAGEKLEDRETGLIHDYTQKQEVVFSEIVLCKTAPKEYADRSTLWTAVQEAETQSNARLAREWEVALPHELDLEQSKKLVHDFAQSLADDGMCVDVNIHWKDGNHHAHLLGTTRAIDSTGKWACKEKKVYKLDAQGRRVPVIDPETGQQKIGARGRKMWQRETVESNDWNRRERVEEWRARWATMCNRVLSQKIDHRSYERQGIERIPTIHEGFSARQMEKKGRISERCQINREIQSANEDLRLLENEKKLLLDLMIRLRDKLKEALSRYKANDTPITTYRGVIMEVTEAAVIQQTKKGIVRHRIEKLERVPEVGKAVKIIYGITNRERARVIDISLDLGLSR